MEDVLVVAAGKEDYQPTSNLPLQVLEERLRRRGSDSEEVIQRRLSMARREIARYREFDYLVISTSIDEDLRLTMAILEAEKMRPFRVAAPVL